MVTLAPWPLSKHVSKVPSPSPASFFFFFEEIEWRDWVGIVIGIAVGATGRTRGGLRCCEEARKKDAGALCQSNDLGMRPRRSKEGCRRLEEGEVGGAPRRAG